MSRGVGRPLASVVGRESWTVVSHRCSEAGDGAHRDPDEPAAHVSDYLALLPSGSDAVRRLKLHRVRAAVRPVTTRGKAQSIWRRLAWQDGTPDTYRLRQADAPIPHGEMSERSNEHAWKLSGQGHGSVGMRREIRVCGASLRSNFMSFVTIYAV